MITNTWLKLDQVKGERPPGRQHHTLVHNRGRIYLFGGKDNDGACSTDVYVLDIASAVWTCQKAGGKKLGKKKNIAPRWGHSATRVSTLDGGFFFVFGGRDAKQFFNDAWVYHFGKGSWELWSAECAPEPRAFHSAILTGERLNIFGGRNGYNFAFNSLFKMDVTKVCAVKVLSPDTLRMIFRMVSPLDLLNLAQVSRQFRTIASSDLLWKDIYENLTKYFTVEGAQVRRIFVCKRKKKKKTGVEECNRLQKKRYFF